MLFAYGVILLTIYAGAGLVDLVLLPFRPLMPSTCYVGPFAVKASRLDGRGTPLAVDHYRIVPPSGRDWYRVTPPDQLYSGARELFIRRPTLKRPSALRAFDNKMNASKGPLKGRAQPAAFVRLESFERGPGTDVRRELQRVVERGRAAPPGSGYEFLSSAEGHYQVDRSDQSFAEQGGLACLRDDFVFLWQDDVDKKTPPSRHVELTTLCADPACPGQAIRLVVRAKADDPKELRREVQAFLSGLSVDPTAVPVCQAPVETPAPPAQVPVTAMAPSPIATPPRTEPAGSGEGWLGVAAAAGPRPRLDVLTRDGLWHKGTLLSLTDASVALEIRGTQLTLERARVWQVWEPGRSSGTKKGFWWGLAAGAVIGVAAYATQGDCADPTSACAQDGYFSPGAAAVTPLVTGAIGAIVGRLVGGPARDARRIYEAPAAKLPAAAPRQ